MSNYPSPSKVVIGSDRVVKVVISRARSYYSDAGTVDLAASTRLVVVAFAKTLKDTNWVFGGFTFWNIADAQVDIVQLAVIGVTAKSQSGFSVLLSTAPPTANYKMDFTIAEETAIV